MSLQNNKSRGAVSVNLKQKYLEGAQKNSKDMYFIPLLADSSHYTAPARMAPCSHPEELGAHERTLLQMEGSLQLSERGHYYPDSQIQTCSASKVAESGA